MTTTIYYHGDAYELAQNTHLLPIGTNHLNQTSTNHHQWTYSIVDSQLFWCDALRKEIKGQADEVRFIPVQRIRFSGKLLLVSDFFQQNLVGKRQNPFCCIEGYETILEMMFKKGYLVRTIDHSAVMNALRGISYQWRNTENELAFLMNLGDWVQAIYGWGYDVWWLPSAA